MTIHKALLIPHDEMQAVEEVEFDTDRVHTWEELVGSKTLDFKSFPTQGAQLMYDDMGLYRQPNNTNVRAMKLWAHLAGVSLDNFRQNLVGNFVVIGMTRYGETADVPGSVRYFFGEEGVKQDA